MTNFKTARYVQTFRTILATAFAIGMLSSIAHAQFSGPALGNNTPANVPAQITTDPAILFPTDRDLNLETGDLLSIHLYGSTDYIQIARVSVDGSIDLPLAGNLHMQGLTVHQAERLIADRLIAAHMYVDPQVSLQITESPNQVVTLTGEVHGVIPTLGKRRLLDVLAASGGLPLTASHTVTIQRHGLDQPIVVDLGTDPTKSSLSNIPVFSGDTIIVPRVGMIYALGAFKLQSAFPLVGNSPLTLLQAMSMAGGANFEGKREDARVIRSIGVKRVEVKVNLSRILAGKDPDPVLQADDIIYLPTSMIKAAIRAGGLATLVGFANFATVYTRN